MGKGDKVLKPPRANAPESLGDIRGSLSSWRRDFNAALSRSALSMLTPENSLGPVRLLAVNGGKFAQLEWHQLGAKTDLKTQDSVRHGVGGMVRRAP
jgi:hypothetical protein